MFVCILVVIIVLMLIGDVLFVGFDSDVVCWVWVFEQMWFNVFWGGGKVLQLLGCIDCFIGGGVGIVGIVMIMLQRGVGQYFVGKWCFVIGVVSGIGCVIVLCFVV